MRATVPSAAPRQDGSRASICAHRPPRALLGILQTPQGHTFPGASLGVLLGCRVLTTPGWTGRRAPSPPQALTPSGTHVAQEPSGQCLPGGRAGALGATCVLRRFLVQPPGPIRCALHAYRWTQRHTGSPTGTLPRPQLAVWGHAHCREAGRGCSRRPGLPPLHAATSGGPGTQERGSGEGAHLLPRSEVLVTQRAAARQLLWFGS